MTPWPKHLRKSDWRIGIIERLRQRIAKLEALVTELKNELVEQYGE